MDKSFEFDFAKYVQDNEAKHDSIFKSASDGVHAILAGWSRDRLEGALKSKVNLDVCRVESVSKITRAMAAANDEQEQARFRESLATAPPALQDVMLDVELNKQHKLLQIDQVRANRNRLLSSGNGRNHNLIPPPILERMIEDASSDGEEDVPIQRTAIDPEEVKRLAMRLVAQVGALPAAESEQQLSTRLADLRRRLPSNIMLDVERQVAEFRTLLV